MNTLDTSPGSSAQLDNLPDAVSPLEASFASDLELKEFLQRHCDPIYNCIARLTGICNTDLLESLTSQVLFDLWHLRNPLSEDQIPGTFIFKILLQHIFAHLKNEGSTNRIELLRNILLIDPAAYRYIIDPGKRTSKQSILYNLLYQIKHIWKIF